MLIGLSINHALGCDWLLQLGWCICVIDMPCLGAAANSKGMMHVICVLFPQKEYVY